VVRAIKVLIPALLILGVSATPSRANHVSITADASAILIERAGSNSWKVKVSWAAVCQGAGGAFFSGNLSLVDMASGESIYLGGISSASGEVFQLVAAKVVNRQLRPEMKINCGDNGTLHGSPTITVFGGSVVIPAIFGRNGSGGGSFGGGGSGGGSGPGDPTEPLQDGGCKPVIIGTTGPDALNGSTAGDIVFGLPGNDVIRGAAGHDCLLGAAGDDKLVGEGGADRLSGGDGRDRLIGADGTNAYDAGPGKDYVDSRNGRREQVWCGSGRDRARVDRRDKLHSCEKVSRPRR
jgi:Ca2+-binding RTX toxin-like protein